MADRCGFGGRNFSGRSPRSRDRAMAPAVGKALEVGVVLLYVALVTTTLFAGVVPEYRTAVARDVSDRVLVSAAENVEGAVPPDTAHVRSEQRVSLPATIRGANYRIRAADGESGTPAALVLEHPDAELGGRLALALPDRVSAVEGSWTSGGAQSVVVEGDETGVVVRLVDGAAPSEPSETERLTAPTRPEVST
ncbi:hypothetical protein [Haloprofundus sp. MHR1]|uniref:DUF7266 family protein n=1 Tax=Haloprofundus sp. MHR1 TaxID=2572921 RepID=UPI00157FCB4F|nr:hypothetical protein [Haloprofundus sp. MHR1]